MHDPLKHLVDSGEDTADLTNLIDVLTLLSAFLMICFPAFATITTELTKAEGQVTGLPPKPSAWLAISRNEEMRWNNEPIPWTDLPARVAAAKASGPNPTVILQSDRAASNGFCQRVRARLARLGAVVQEIVQAED